MGHIQTVYGTHKLEVCNYYYNPELVEYLRKKDPKFFPKETWNPYLNCYSGWLYVVVLPDWETIKIIKELIPDYSIRAVEIFKNECFETSKEAASRRDFLGEHSFMKYARNYWIVKADEEHPANYDKFGPDCEITYYIGRGNRKSSFAFTIYKKYCDVTGWPCSHSEFRLFGSFYLEKYLINIAGSEFLLANPQFIYDGLAKRNELMDLNHDELKYFFGIDFNFKGTPLDFYHWYKLEIKQYKNVRGIKPPNIRKMLNKGPKKFMIPFQDPLSENSKTSFHSL